MLFAHTRTLLAAGAAAASLVAGAAEVVPSTTSYNLLHRVGSFASAGEWTIRGTIQLSSADQSVAAAIATDVETDNATAAASSIAGSKYTSTISASDVKALYDQALSSEASDLVYQLALSPATSPSALDGLPSTSVKLCHLRQSHADLPTLDDQLTVHVRRSASASTDKSAVATPFGLSYRVLDIQLGPDGCPVPNGAKMALVNEEARKERQRQAARRSRRKQTGDTTTAAATSAGTSVKPAFDFRTDFHLSSPNKPHTPPLKAPLPTREDGTIQTPEPEKTLLQKYWYYLIPVAILILMPATEEDPAKQGAEGHPSSEAAGTGMGAKQLK